MPSLDNNYPVDLRYQAFENHENGLLVSCAGPGTGKTFSFLRRIRSLTQIRHISVEAICYLTFIKEISNSFNNEYLEEFPEQVDSQARPRISTLHSFACRLIKNRGFTIRYDGSLYFANWVSEDDPSSVIFINDLIPLLTRFRNRSLSRIKGLIGEVKAAWRNNHDPMALHSPIPSFLTTVNNLAHVYRLIDWDQAIPLATMLYQIPENRERWLLRFQHYLIDEYQDFNSAEQSFISAIIPNIESIVIVGDDNQSIYSSRGASPSGLLHLVASRDVDSVNLLRCRRQKTVLLHATNSFLHYMRPQSPALLPFEAGGEVHSFRFKSSKAENNYLIGFLNDAVHSLPPNPRSRDGIICLFPSKKSLRYYYDQLNPHVNCTLRNPPLFPDRLLLLRLLELIINPNQRFIERLILENFPLIKRRHKNAIINICLRDDVSVSTALNEIINQNTLLSEAASESAREYCGICQAFSSRNIDEIVRLLPTLIPIEANGLTDRIIQFISSVDEPNHEEIISRTCDQLLPQFANPVEQLSSVLFLTIQGSKGLTKHTVVLPGLEDAWLPGQSEGDKLQEKQRLFFVALTRATDRILITIPATRARGDPLNFTIPGRGEPSRFIRSSNILTNYHE